MAIPQTPQESLNNSDVQDVQEGKNLSSAQFGVYLDNAADNTQLIAGRAKEMNGVSNLVPGLDLFDSQASANESTMVSAQGSMPTKAEAQATDGPGQDATQANGEAVQLFGNQNSSSQYREDGSIESRSEMLEDGSTRNTRYYPPTNPETWQRSEQLGLPLAPLLDAGNPEDQTVTRPDGSSEYTSFSTNGDRELIQRIDSSGNVTTFTRQEDGSYRGDYLGRDGSLGTGTFNSDLTTRETVLNYPDGSRYTENRNENGISTVLTDANGNQTTTRMEPSGNFISDSTVRPDGSRSSTTRQEDGSSLRERFAPNGDRIGSIMVPPMTNGQLSELPSGGVELRYNSPDGRTSRVVTTDAFGRVQSETSMHADGRTPRELINYNHSTGTRSITSFNSAGLQTSQRNNERYTPPVLR